MERSRERTIDGWICGALGVMIFSGSMPATQAALAGFDPLFLTTARAVLAGVMAFALLCLRRQPWPARRDFISLVIVAAGVVIGFPLLSAMALRSINAVQSQIFVALLPLVTALFGVIRAGERPGGWFWLFAVLGSFCVIALVARQGADMSGTGMGLMLLAIFVCGLGYAEGAKLARRLGGWQVISWALSLALPFTLVLGWLHRPAGFALIGMEAWLGLGYVSFFSMFIGFIFWYRGLALGGITSVGQLQLLQPGLGLLASAMVLNEKVPPAMVFAIAGVIACVAGARRFSYTGRR